VRNPANAAAANELGIVERKLGKFQEAEAAYQRAVAAETGLRAGTPHLGVLYDLYLGEPQQALEQFENYIQLAGENKQVAGWVAELRKRVGSAAPAAKEGSLMNTSRASLGWLLWAVAMAASAQPPSGTAAKPAANAQQEAGEPRADTSAVATPPGRVPPLRARTSKRRPGRRQPRGVPRPAAPGPGPPESAHGGGSSRSRHHHRHGDHSSPRSCTWCPGRNRT